jgi:hypothetical protein
MRYLALCMTVFLISCGGAEKADQDANGDPDAPVK